MDLPSPCLWDNLGSRARLTMSHEKKIRLKFQALCGLGALFCALLLTTAYGLEFFLQLVPCPLCLLQRYVIWIMTIIFFLAILHRPIALGRYIYASIILILSGVGSGLAIWQLWLQYSPAPKTATCIASLERLFEYYSLKEALEMLLGSVGCGQVDFVFLHLSLAAWSLLAFIALAVLSFLLIMGHKKRRID